jgi:glutaredoxin
MAKVIVTLFSLPDCPHCEAGRLFLRRQSVDFVDRDVSIDPEALQDMLFLLGRAEVPALYSGYMAATGFDERQWLDILAQKRDIERDGDPFILPRQLRPDPFESVD